MKALLSISMIALLACCATPAPITEVQTREVVVTRTERAITPDQLPEPPAPLGARPSAVSAALDLAVAQLCAWVSYAERADSLLQIAAGAEPQNRISEPVCRPAEQALQPR